MELQAARPISRRVEVGTARLSLDAHYLEVDDRFCAIMRRSREALLGSNSLDITHPDDTATSRSLMVRLATGFIPEVNIEKRYIAPDGSPIWVRITSVMLKTEAGDDDCFVLVAEEIGPVASRAEHKGQAVMPRHLTFGTSFARQATGTHGGALDQPFPLEGFIRATRGVNPMTLPQSRWVKFKFRPSMPGVSGHRGLSRVGVGRAAGLGAVRRPQLVQGDRTGELETALRVSQLQLDREIARRITAETALAASRKLEALGQLTDGISHDFNNVVMAISSGFSLIARRSTDVHVINIARQGLHAAERGGKLVKQLLAFARQKQLDPVAVDVACLLQDALPLLNRAGPQVQIEIACSPALPAVQADPSLLEAVLINLTGNACDAITGQGAVRIEVTLAEADDPDWPVGLRGPRALRLCVIDNGCGIAEEVLQHVTEPFFTTKAAGKGTGLGLSMVDGFLRETGGALHIASQPDEGTSVTLYLPLAETGDDICQVLQAGTLTG